MTMVMVGLLRRLLSCNTGVRLFNFDWTGTLKRALASALKEK